MKELTLQNYPPLHLSTDIGTCISLIEKKDKMDVFPEEVKSLKVKRAKLSLRLFQDHVSWDEPLNYS